MVMDRFADVRSALQPAECVLQKAMDAMGKGGDDIRHNVEDMLMWSKGSDTMQALPSGLDALLERRIEDAARETAEMQSENSFPLKSIRVAAQAILGAGECSTPRDFSTQRVLFFHSDEKKIQHASACSRSSRRFLRRYPPCMFADVEARASARLT